MKLILTIKKNNLDIVSIVESAGVELRRSGTRHVGLCPFHEDKSPSFFVFDDQHFKCFGCGEHGDVIDFVQKMYNLSFQDALRYLGIEQGKITPKMQRETDRRKRKAELIRKFNKWRSEYIGYLGTMINRTRKLMKNITPDDLDLYAALLQRLPVWKYHFEILAEGRDKSRYELYKEALKCRKKILI